MAVLGGYMEAMRQAIEQAVSGMSLAAPDGKSRPPYVYVGDLPYRRKDEDNLAPFISLSEVAWVLERNRQVRSTVSIECVSWLPDSRRSEIGAASALADCYAMVNAVISALLKRDYRDTGWIVASEADIKGVAGLPDDGGQQPWPFAVMRVTAPIIGVLT